MATQLCLSLIAGLALIPPAGAQAPATPSLGESGPLSAVELQQITLELLARYPQLAASPGVKSAGPTIEGGPGTVVGTSVIFHPHAEDHGIKEAYEALCSRAYPVKAWTCDVRIRRYIQLATQSWEVRVRGDVSSDAALALLDASRRDLEVSVPEAAAIASTALLVTQHRDAGYYVSWGTPDGALKVNMLGTLEPDGDPTNPDDWHTTRLITESD